MWRWVGTVLLILLVSAVASAQPISRETREAAREHFVRGVARMRVEDWAGAVEALERARDIAPLAVVFYNLGIAHEQLDQPVEAVAAMQRALDDPSSLKPERIARAKQTIAQQSARIGMLRIAVSEPDASIGVDGRDVGTSPLDAPLSLASGIHYVEVVKRGFSPERREVSVTGEKTVSLDVNLEPTDKQFAQLWIKSNLRDAEIWLDGKRIGTTPLAQSIPVLPGEHRVAVKRPGYDEARDLFDIGPGATRNVQLDPRPNKDEIKRIGGTLALESEALEDLVLTIDGDRYGPYTSPIALAPGSHDVVVERAGFVAGNLEILIDPGATTSREVLLDPTAETIAEHNGDVALYQGFGWTLAGVGALAIGGGIGFTVWNANDIGDREDDFLPKVEPGGMCEPGSAALGQNRDACVEEATALDDARARRPLSAIFFVGGGALLTTGVVLLILSPDADKYVVDDEGEELALTPMVAPTGDGVLFGLHGAF